MVNTIKLRTDDRRKYLTEDPFTGVHYWTDIYHQNNNGEVLSQVKTLTADVALGDINGQTENYYENEKAWTKNATKGQSKERCHYFVGRDGFNYQVMENSFILETNPGLGSFEVNRPQLWYRDSTGNEGELSVYEQPLLILKVGFSNAEQVLGQTCAAGVFFPSPRYNGNTVNHDQVFDFTSIPYVPDSQKFDEYSANMYHSHYSWFEDDNIIRKTVGQGFSGNSDEYDGQSQDPGTADRLGHMFFPVFEDAPYFTQYMNENPSSGWIMYVQAHLVLPIMERTTVDVEGRFQLLCDIYQHKYFGEGAELHPKAYGMKQSDESTPPGR